MHRANVAIFLTAIGLIGVAPIVLGIVYLVRQRADGRSSEEVTPAARSTVVAVAVVMAVLLAAGGSAAWVLAARGLGAPSSDAGGGMGG